MKLMELIIDIPKEEYERIKDISNEYRSLIHKVVVKGARVTEQGTKGGIEYKRTSDDFCFRWLEMDCICSICNGIGARIEFTYVTRDYESASKKNLQEHEHYFWICPACLLMLDSKANAVKENVKHLFRNGRKIENA